MVLSPLPLAILFPSGLHATDQTLKLREVNANQQKQRRKNLKKAYEFECPDTGHSQTYRFISFKFEIFSMIYLSKKRHLFEKPVSLTLTTRTYLFCLFS